MPHYQVKLPDGSVEEFDGPEMSDLDAYQRAVQTQKFRTGEIPTTKLGGFMKALGEDRATTGALISGAGYVTGNPAIVAAAPILSRGIEYGTKKLTGQNPTLPSKSEVATDVALGAVQGYGPSVVTGLAKPLVQNINQLPITSVPQAVARGLTPSADKIATVADAVAPETVGATVSGLRQAASQAALTGLRNADIARRGVTVDDYQLMKQSVQKGMSAYTAARVVAGKDANQLQRLLELWARWK